MARITIEDCLDKVHNRFALVLLVAKRAKQLLKGSESTIASKGNKMVVTSLREVAARHVFFDCDESLESADQQIENDLNR